MEKHLFEKMAGLLSANDSKIILLVLDGLGGLPSEPEGLTELETAMTPNLDALAKEGICGLHLPVGPGITPGSGPGHLGIFGYDPLQFQIGRGALAAAGIGFDLQPGDVAVRGNFCTLDDEGRVTDRRAGRIDTGTNQQLCEKLHSIELEETELFVQTIKEHRFLAIFRGEGLSDHINDTDPQETGKHPLDPEARDPEAKQTATVFAQFTARAREVLAGDAPANGVLLRGAAKKPGWPPFQKVFGLNAAAAAAYPMYRGIARLLGMSVLPQPESFEEEIRQVKERFDEFDFFFIHFKPSDSLGEDGNFEAKTEAIQKADESVAALRDLHPDVLLVTGDHSTPAGLKTHSWHPVPVLLGSPTARTDPVDRFGERACMAGGLGPRFPAVDLLPLALAHAGRLKKFGA
jgi:2,3-bisphosphoglycerate-independent phosphoglycerate mutase